MNTYVCEICKREFKYTQSTNFKKCGKCTRLSKQKKH